MSVRTRQKILDSLDLVAEALLVWMNSAATWIGGRLNSSVAASGLLRTLCWTVSTEGQCAGECNLILLCPPDSRGFLGLSAQAVQQTSRPAASVVDDEVAGQVHSCRREDLMR